VRFALAATTLIVGVPTAALQLGACGDPSYVYEGQLYRSDRDCLATVSSVDVVSGDRDRARVCPPVCLVQTSFDAERVVYVSTMCAPYPFAFDDTGADPECAPALAAFARGDTCLVDGTSTNPLPGDAGDGG
jgi:hypothetical protein